MPHFQGDLDSQAGPVIMLRVQDFREIVGRLEAAEDSLTIMRGKVDLTYDVSKKILDSISTQQSVQAALPRPQSVESYGTANRDHFTNEGTGADENYDGSVQGYHRAPEAAEDKASTAEAAIGNAGRDRSESTGLTGATGSSGLSDDGVKHPHGEQIEDAKPDHENRDGDGGEEELSAASDSKAGESFNQSKLIDPKAKP